MRLKHSLQRLNCFTGNPHHAEELQDIDLFRQRAQDDLRFMIYNQRKNDKVDWKGIMIKAYQLEVQEQGIREHLRQEEERRQRWKTNPMNCAAASASNSEQSHDDQDSDHHNNKKYGTLSHCRRDSRQRPDDELNMKRGLLSGTKKDFPVGSFEETRGSWMSRLDDPPRAPFPHEKSGLGHPPSSLLAIAPTTTTTRHRPLLSPVKGHESEYYPYPDTSLSNYKRLEESMDEQDEFAN